MWPLLLDMTKEESMQHLRCLEIDAFSGLVNALRAQGSLNTEKLNLLKETSNMLHISQERHKAEIRRVVNDERLNTIAYHVNGERHCGEEWADEGQRLIPLMPRVAPQTAYSAIADEVADATSKLNKQLPLPASTDRKRVASSPPTHPNATSTTSSTSQQMYRGVESERKRKLSMNMDNCVLAQHLMAPPKISKIQQLYRQKSVYKLKDQLVKVMPTEACTKSEHAQLTKVFQKATPSGSTPSKVNIIQNITTALPQKANTTCVEVRHEVRVQSEGKVPKNDEFLHLTKPNLIPRPPSTLTATATSVSSTSHPTTSVNVPNTKTITTTDGQKLIVVSTHSTLTPNASILQRTLTTIPLKTVNPKYRLVARDSNAVNRQNALNAAAKHKMAMVRHAANRRVVPYSNVQVLNTPGGLKVVAGRKQLSVQKHPTHLNERLKHLKPLVSSKLKEYPKQVINVSIDSITKGPLTRLLPKEACITIGDTSVNLEEKGNCHVVNGVSEETVSEEATDVVGDSEETIDDQSSKNTNVDTLVDSDMNSTSNQNGADSSNIEETTEILLPSLQCDDVIPMSDEDVEDNNILEHGESIDTNNVVLTGEDSIDVNQDQHFIEDMEDDVHSHMEERVEEETVVYEEKVDLDSSVFIYDNENEEVIIEGMEDQPIEVLNAVHTLDEKTFSNMKNVRS